MDAAALRAAVEALCSSDARDENLSPTEMVTAAAMAAMRAMPDAPLVHAVVPSVVAAAMVTAPPVADPNAVDAPVALAARPAARDAATDVDGLHRAVDVGTDAAAMTRAAKSGPDARDDPEVVLAAPRDVGTSPGVRARVRDVSVGVGTRVASPPPGFAAFPPETRECGVDPSPLVADAALNTEVSAAAFAKDVTATKARDEALEKLASMEAAEGKEREKTAKWKARCESLRAELAGAMERRAEAETKAKELQTTLDSVGTRKRERVARSVGGVGASVGGEGDAADDASSAPAAEEGANAALDDALAAADALRRELETREDEHAKAVSATRAAIRNLRGSSPRTARRTWRRSAYTRRTRSGAGANARRGRFCKTPCGRPPPRRRLRRGERRLRARRRRRWRAARSPRATQTR